MLRQLQLIWLLLLTGCASLQIDSDYDTAVDFTGLGSYDWLPAQRIQSGDPAIEYDSLLEARVRNAVETQLSARGLVRDTGQPDVLVTYHAVQENKVSVTYLNDLYGYGPGWLPRYRGHLPPYGYPGAEVVVTEYRQGTLIIDVVRASDRRLIWRGTATDDVYPDGNALFREQRVREAVEKIMARFPPPSQE